MYEEKWIIHAQTSTVSKIEEGSVISSQNIPKPWSLISAGIKVMQYFKKKKALSAELHIQEYHNYGGFLMLLGSLFVATHM